MVGYSNEHMAGQSHPGSFRDRVTNNSGADGWAGAVGYGDRGLRGRSTGFAAVRFAEPGSGAR